MLFHVYKALAVVGMDRWSDVYLWQARYLGGSWDIVRFIEERNHIQIHSGHFDHLWNSLRFFLVRFRRFHELDVLRHGYHSLHKHCPFPDHASSLKNRILHISLVVHTEKSSVARIFLLSFFECSKSSYNFKNVFDSSTTNLFPLMTLLTDKQRPTTYHTAS